MNGDPRIALDQHPRARHSIAQAKGLGGIVCFAVVAFISLRAGVPFFDSGVRALVAGIGGYAVVWFGAVQVWRQLALAEIRRHEANARELRRRAEEELEALRATASETG
ncbi:MAG: hypothetical protein ACJ768_11010 [Gaiellaceae bacterium]